LIVAGDFTMRRFFALLIVSILLAFTCRAWADQAAKAGTTQPAAQMIDVPLPGEVSASCAGGGGRWLVFEIADNQQLAIYDVKQSKVVGSIPLADTDVAFAATSTKLFVGLKGLGQLQRWDLQNHKLEQTTPAPQGGIKELAAAVDAPGPVVLIGDKRMWLIDPATLAAEKFKSDHWGTDGSAWGPVTISVSFDGTAIVAEGGGWAGSEFTRFVDGNIVPANMDMRLPDDAIVSGDGLLVLTSSGIYHADNSSKVTGIDGQAFPGEDRAFSLALVKNGQKGRPPKKPKNQANAKQAKGPSLVIFNNADPRPLVTLNNLPELAADSKMPIGQRVYLIPKLGQLITLGEGANHLIVRPFNLAGELDALGTPYLFVATTPQTFLASGEKFSYKPQVVSKTGGVTFALQSGPGGMTVGADGALSWTVPQNFSDANALVILQIGDASGKTVFQNFRIRIADSKSVSASPVVRAHSVPPPVVASAGPPGRDNAPSVPKPGVGNAPAAVTAPPPLPAAPQPANYPTELTLALGTEDAGCTPGLKSQSGLVLQKSRLTRVAADGITAHEHWDLDTEYSQIYERPDYFVALAKSPGSIDLLDLKTSKRIKRIKLPFPQISEMACLPGKPLSYVTVAVAADHGPRSCIIVVNESTGDAHQPDNAVGTFLAVNASGTRLYSGYKDIYQKGVELFMNPDGNIWDTPQYGAIDILMEYDLSDPTAPKLLVLRDSVGKNGSGIRVSTDGKRVSYLSFTGYPDFSKCVPAWDPNDLGKVPVTYDCKDKGDNRKMNYHPSLPLVIVPGNHGPLFFDRESGDPSPDRVQLPEALFNGQTLADVYFSPDGLNAILKCQRGSNYFLYKVPLKLSPQEETIVHRGPPSDGGDPAQQANPPTDAIPGSRA
jgi:hypothetical protein